MFYLNQFFKILAKSPIRGVCLVLFSVLLVFSISQKKYLSEQFANMIPDNQAGDYFYALIASTEQYASIARQMNALPGVYRAEILSEAQIAQEVKNILGNLDVDLTESKFDLKYVGLKIIYTRDLKPRAQDLVRDYLTHLVGENNITLGAVKSSDMTNDKRAQFIGVIKTWGYSIYLFLIFTFWTISLLLTRYKIAEASYLLESYQRKRKVGLKVALNGLMLIFFVSAALSFILGIPDAINLLIAFGIFVVGVSIHFKKLTWESH